MTHHSEPTDPVRVPRLTRLLTATVITAALSAQRTLPPPAASGIEHVIVVMMENRSFDHMLGWLKDADGKQENLVYRDRNGVPHQTYGLAPDFQGCAHPDPDHSFGGGRVEYNGGACDGWLRAGNNDLFAIGYYVKRDLPFYGEAAPRWTVCDRYFSAIMAETYPNRIIQFAGQTDRLTNAVTLCTLPTIWDRLADANRTGRYYFSDVPFLALWGLRYLPISRPLSSFFADAAAGTLPNVAFVDPRFIDANTGTSGDDHPHADIRNGQVFLEKVYRAVTTSPQWSSSVLIINYDEWGGFFDHVPPPVAPIPPGELALGNTDGLRGFRVPCIVVSPFAGDRVSKTVFDHCSILRMIEWRWGLAPLTVRDAQANNLAEALDFKGPRSKPRQFSMPPGPFGSPCLGRLPGGDKWDLLHKLAILLGWPLG